MRLHRVLSSWCATFVACLALVPAAGCTDAATPAPPATDVSLAHQVAAQPSALYDLERDERLGGHTLARHTGRSDRDLADRLRNEPQISAASTYTDPETAERVVAATIERYHDRVIAWAGRSGSRPNLVLHYQQPDRDAIGRSLSRGARSTRPCSRALVVLRWSERTRGWFVLTSYPEP